MVITEFIQSNPTISIVIISILATFAVTIIRYFMTDKEKMKEIKQRQKDLKLEMKKYKDHPEKMLEIQKKMMADMPEQLKHSFKPMIITLIPFLILLSWLKATFAATSIAGTWFWWYLVVSVVTGIIFSKLFGLQ